MREAYLKTTASIRGTTPESEASARAMRRDPTPAERRLWQALRGRQLGGLQFRRQHPLGPYILDFCCPSCRLVVELDGSSHQKQAEYDEVRTEQLETFGYQVLRFPNEDVLTDLGAVLAQILSAAEARQASGR